MFELSKKLLKKITIPWEPPEHGCLKKWRKRVEKAIARGHFTGKDERDSKDWSVCACGEAYAKFDGLSANQKGDEPRDEALERLGLAFAERVCGYTWDGDDDYEAVDPDAKEALFVLDRIEKRLKTLDREFRTAHKKALSHYKKTGDIVPLVELFAGIGKNIEPDEDENV